MLVAILADEHDYLSVVIAVSVAADLAVAS